MTPLPVSVSANLIYGLGGNDRLTGGPFADQIYGGEGNDQFNATAGADHHDERNIPSCYTARLSLV